MRLISLSLFILLTNLAHAQKSVNYFADSTKTGSNCHIFSTEVRDKYIYIGGQSFDSGYTTYTPTLVKLDTAGNTIWTYSLNKQLDTTDYDANTLYTDGYYYNITTDSTAIYANMYAPYYGHELWKIDQVTGEAIWRKRVIDAMVIKNADSKHLIYTYNTSLGYIYEMIDKATGESVMTKVLTPTPQAAETGTITIEPDGSTYISRGDSVFYYASPTLSVLNWTAKINITCSVSYILPGDDGYLYIAGYGAAFFAGRIKKKSGEIQWISGSNLNNWQLDDFVSDCKIKGNYIYVSGQQIYYGSVYTSYHICKFDRETGKLMWETNYNPNTVQPSPSVPYAGTNSIVIDEHDNVYATGYENAGDNKAAIWGVCKFNAAGSLVYHAQLFDHSVQTMFGKGVFSFELNKHIFYLGELQKDDPMPSTIYTGYSNSFLIATDTSGTFTPYKKQKINSTYQEFSATMQIEPFSAKSYLVYKKVGNEAVIEMKNAKDGSVIWMKSFKRGFHSEADKMCVTTGNNIYISILSYPLAEMQFDYSAYADSIYFIKLDSLGNFLKEHKYSIAQQHDFKSLQLFATNDSGAVYIYKNKGWNNLQLISFFNIEKATVELLDGSAAFNSTYVSTDAHQAFLAPLTKDIYAAVQNRFYPGNNFNTPLLYDVSFKNSSSGFNAGAGYSLPQFIIVYEKVQTHYILPFDSVSVIMFGTDDKGTGQVFLVNKKAKSTVWKNTLPVSDYLDMATLDFESILATGRRGNNLLVQKLSASTGKIIWEKTIPPNSGQRYTPVEQKFNDQKKQYIVSGYIIDTLPTISFTTRQLAFYIVIDSNGIVLSKWIQPGDYKQQNNLSAIGITPYGQSIIGGALYKYPLGRSGVLIEADTAIAKIETDSTVVLPENIITVTAELVEKNKAKITWSVTLNEKIDYFEIQHSIDGINFETLETQPSTTTSGYLLYSDTTSALVEGTHYFRINSIDADSYVQYSDTVSIIIPAEDHVLKMQISPNPASNHILIQLPAPIQNTDALIYNVPSGKLVKKITNISGIGISCDISSLRPGIYIIKVKDSETVFTGRFVKM